MESGNPPTLMAQARKSWGELGIRPPFSEEERIRQRQESEQVEEQDKEILRRPPMLKLRGHELSLEDYIAEKRVRQVHA